jgi:AraC family transcriptional regulator
MAVILGHDDFYGRLHVRLTVPGFAIAHRIAAGPPESVAMHTHVEAHFVLVTSGQYVSSAKGSPGERLPLVYNPAGTTHRDHFCNGVGSFLTVSVASDVVDRDRAARLHSHPAILTDRRSRGLAAALLWTSTHDPHAMAHLESLALELVGGVVDDRRRNSPCSASAPWLDRAFEQVQDGFARPLTVRAVAAAAGVHPVYLARTFRLRFGCTPGQLLQLRRLERAADRLVCSRMPLAEIAHSCGFTDQSHLTTAFRRVYGMPPGRFRSSFIFPRRTVGAHGTIDR